MTETNEVLDGVAIVLDSRPPAELWTIDNETPGVRHLAFEHFGLKCHPDVKTSSSESESGTDSDD